MTRTGPLLWSTLLAACSAPEIEDSADPPPLTEPREDRGSPPTTRPAERPPVVEVAGGGFAYGRAILEPLTGTYYGVNLDYDALSIPEYNARIGRAAATYVQFVDFPMSEWDRQRMEVFLHGVADVGGIAILTFEPHIELWEITPEMADDLASWLGWFNEARELGVLVRWAHEMNGSWYLWSQQPTEYIRVWRMMADAVHTQAPRTGMLWAPSYAGGYPFSGGWYEAHPGTQAFEILDTDDDGVLTMWDDAYAPYYPGDAYVDWVGLSLYHWGDDHPWGDNQIPEPNKFIEHMTGTYDGLAGDESGLTDFYATFVEGHDKPMAIVETAALYNPGRWGDPEFEIKSLWWDQVFADEVFERFPRLRMINWFEWDKDESEIGGERIDWTVTADPVLREAYLADLPFERFVFSPLPPYPLD